MTSSPYAQLNALADPPSNWRAVFGWRRVRTVTIICALFVLLFSFGWKASMWHLVARVFGVGLALLLVFGLFEQWPRRLPRWMARWALQVAAVGVTVPLAFFAAFLLSTAPGAAMFWKTGRLEGFMTFTFLGMLVAPWTALAALLRQREAKVEKQAIDFELERSEIVRQMLDVRKRLLTAQAQPHFLFNTLANAQALVEAGSPRAPKEGGCIDMHAQALQGGRCRLRVVDTGVGLRASGGGLGTGLAALQIVAQARNGRQAIELFEQHQPAICFLDVHMPGLSGVEVARHVGKRAHLVFVTAFDQYALEAFEHGVLDYLVKPVTAARLTETVERLKARLQQAQPAVHSDVLLAQLDPAHFAQVHRSVVINLRSIRRVTRGENETADIELKGRTERLPMSRSYLHLFKEM